MWEPEFSSKRNSRTQTKAFTKLIKKVRPERIAGALSRLWSADMLVNTRVPPGDPGSRPGPGAGHHIPGAGGRARLGGSSLLSPARSESVSPALLEPHLDSRLERGSS